MLLTEIFDKKYEYELDYHTDGVAGEFETDDNSYVSVDFDMFKVKNSEHRVLDLQFERNGSIKRTGGGDAAAIFATVIAMSHEVLAHSKPACLVFMADKDDASRVSLYRRLGKKLQDAKYICIDDKFDKVTDENLREFLTRKSKSWTESNEVVALVRKDLI